ncbi:MAG: glycosyltransferase family 39 protein [Candidatus Micrarchaeia archaeon]|nr:glycosyltransferase family 39 protein [Candidatus Aenigmarchaeota archaeon]
MKKSNIILLVILVASLTIGLWMACQDVLMLINKIVLDDSFYGFSIARSIANGHGVTYNGIDQTNGFQPLWVLMIVPIFMITSNIYLAVNLVLVLAAIINTLTVLLVYKFAQNVFGEKIALIAIVLYGLNPFVMFQTLSGIDVVLFTFLVIVTIYFYNKIEHKFDKKNLCVLGVLIGMTMLARMDGLLLFAAIWLYMLWKNKKHPLIAIKHGFIIGIVALLVVLPWFAWSYTTFGTIVQSSAIARYNMGHGIFPYADLKAPKTLAQTASMVMENFVRAAGSILNQLGIFNFGIDMLTIILFLFIVSTLMFSVKSLKRFTVPVIFVILLVLFYCLYMWGVQVRYMTPVIPMITILISAGLVSMFKKHAWLVQFILIVVLTIIAFNGLQQWDRGYFAWSGELYKDALWIRENIAPNESVGVFSSGIHTYFSNRRVVNLDGVLNFKAIKALEDRDIISYMKSENISVWVESVYFNHSVTNEYRKGRHIDIMKENIWYDFLGPDKDNLILIEQREGVYKHLRGYDMLVVFFKARVN